jgi:peptidoglycan-associated lipoprotein
MSRLSSPALRGATLGAVILIAALGVGCTKKAPLPPRTANPPLSSGGENNPPNAMGRPAIVTFTVEPSTVERGQSATLKWSVTNATSVIIDHGVGSVDVSGQRTVVPADSTTYALTARNENGSTAATATVNVTVPVPTEAPPDKGRGPRGTITQQIEHLQDAYFDYDKNDIRGDAQTALTADASALKQIFADFPTASIIVEGHCDERGSAEYNLGLGDRRASSARDFLVQLGVPADKLKTVSYGKERPKCTDATEDCYQQNRRAHFSAGQ